jgi:aminoglycoside phosphotransferase (APT) family kinase protein
VAFSDDLVVKIGGDVTRDEFENQERAHEILMPVNSVKVPQPYAFFRRQGLGYLVMEHIHGEQIQPSDPSSVQKVVDLLRVFATIRGEKPGPLGGGPSRGLLWSEYHDFKPESIEDVEKHFSARIKDGSEIALYPYPLTLCHGDLAERNIKICENQLCILDWASAGFYPKLFEIAAMQKNTVEPLLMKVLQSVQEIAWLNENESFLANCIERAASSNIRYISYVQTDCQERFRTLICL